MIHNEGIISNEWYLILMMRLAVHILYLYFYTSRSLNSPYVLTGENVRGLKWMAFLLFCALQAPVSSESSSSLEQEKYLQAILSSIPACPKKSNSDSPRNCALIGLSPGKHPLIGLPPGKHMVMIIFF